LTDSDYAELAASWIRPEDADDAMLRRVDEIEGREVTGQKGRRDCRGRLFSYYWPGEPRPFNYRVRRDNPDWTVGKDGKPKEEAKYLGPPKSGNRLYIPPGVTPEQLGDAKLPRVVVEGEKKALALWRLARYDHDNPRFIPIAIPGVWNWRGVIAKAGGARGQSIDVKGPIPDLSRIAWKGSKVFILFDADVATNDSVWKARRGISRELASRGAEVFHTNLPENCGVKGVDELLAAEGPQRVLELLANSVRGSRQEVVAPPQYKSTPEGMFRSTELSRTQLSNYQAAIRTSIILDDGVETKREFEIEAELIGRRYQFTIPAHNFARMDWPIEEMGPAAITFPNLKEYARTAIQSFSFVAEERRIYTHTGWRKIDGEWLYLHGGGAIGRMHAVTGIDVRLAGALGRYVLKIPANRDAVIEAVRSSLRLLELGPPAVSFPLRATTFRAVLGEGDFAVHLTGATGVFKSERAALEQQHFGAGMDRMHLPASWSSTPNANENLTFHAKDALLTIDDFSPQGTGLDLGRYHAAADRIFRAVGNHAGRSRLDSTAKLLETKPPRGLILSTGEEIPRGHSIRARLLILELSKGDIDASMLTECQRDAQAGRYSEAMGAFVQWLAGRYETVRTAANERIAQLRAEAEHKTVHARTPEIVGNLQFAFELFLQFSEECGAIRSAERKTLAQRCWAALLEAAAAQAKHQTASEPTELFLALLRGSLSSGRAHLETRLGAVPESAAQAYGWRRDSYTNWQPLGDCIGWVDGDHIYLEPTATFRIVQMMGRDIGEMLPISLQTMKKRLREKKLLASIDQKRQTLTVRRIIGGSTIDVLDFLRSSLHLEESDNSDNPDFEASPDGKCRV
jgi:hypothetical protein